VRDPVSAPIEDGPGVVDPGRDYEVIRMEHDVWGGGEELARAIHELNLDERPNPPALFALLRTYSLLGSQRARTMASLRGVEWGGVEVEPAGGSSEGGEDPHAAILTFRATNGYVAPRIKPSCH